MDGLRFLLEIGFESGAAKMQAAAEAIMTLVHRSAVSWNVLQVAIAPHLEGLEDLMVDAPRANRFFHQLVALLLVTCGSSFDPAILELLLEGAFGQRLLLGAMQEVKAVSGEEETGNA